MKTAAFALLVCCLMFRVGLAQTRDVAGAPATEPAEAKQQFVRSLVLRADRVIADSTHPSILWLAQSSPSAYRPGGPVKLRLALAPAAADAEPIKELGTFDIAPRDLSQRPIGLSAEMDGVADGGYRIVARITEGDAPLATLERPLWLVKGIDGRRAAVRERLAKIAGHESTKASILYPFDLARVFNSGKRAFNAADLGLNEKGEADYYAFAQGMQRSEELLSALEAGRDSLWRAKGDTKRAYWFAEAGEIMPYRTYVPSTWDGTSALPLVFILHGATRNQDFYFDRDERIIPRMAEKHGFMLAGTFGYHPNGGYNYGSMTGANRRGGSATFGPSTEAPVAGGRGNFMDGMPADRFGALSEADSMHVLDLVKKEYPIDPKRIYLFGYSMGGNGGYYIGGKYADQFASIAIGGASAGPDNYPYFDTFKRLGTSMFIYFGQADGAGVLTGSRNMAAAMKLHGIETVLKEYPGIDHTGAPAAGVADAFEFFTAHPRK